MGHINILCR